MIDPVRPMVWLVLAGSVAPSVVAQGNPPDTVRPATRAPAAPAALARIQGWMPLATTGIPRFLTTHPEWDGRGVLIAILDSGVDPGALGLDSTSSGLPKILDLRDFSGEGAVALAAVAPRGDTIRFARRRLLGASRLRSLSSGPWYAGLVAERPLGQLPAADLNDNGTNADSLLVVVARTRDTWILLADTDGDGTLANEAPIRDFLEGRETFGWHRGNLPPPLTVAVNFREQGSGPPLLRLVFDTEAHGTHVAGIAAGRSIGGIRGFDGVAPGAQLLGLKISRNDLGGITTTGSVVEALDYAIRFAARRSLPLVVNMSFGVGNEREGAARLDALLDSTLAAHPDVVFVTSAGNDGPGISTMGFPGSARRAVTVGAVQAAPFLPPSAGGVEPMLYFSSRGGELAKPDVLAPGTAYSTVPLWNLGEEFKSGTSMAAPHVAGLAALLVSAARAEGRAVSASDIGRALAASARSVPGQTGIDQGAGIPDLEAAWRALRSPPLSAEFEVQLKGRPGATGSFTIGRADSVVTFQVIRTRGNTPVELSWSSSVSWLSAPERIRIDAETTAVILRQTLRASPGTHSGAVLARFNGIPVFRLTSTVVFPASRETGPVSVSWRNLLPGATQRLTFPADSGRPFQVSFATRNPGQQLIASLHQPGGQPMPGDNGIPAGPDSLAAVFDIDGADARGGYYEAVATGNPERSADATLTVRHAPARLSLAGRGDSLEIGLIGMADSATAGTLRLGVLGIERVMRVDTAGSGDVRLPLLVPAWADELVADLRFDRDQWPRFTDFGFAVVNQSGEILEKEPANYATTRMRLSLAPDQQGKPLDILLAPGFADPGFGQRWKARVTVRFLAAEPALLEAREGEAFSLPARGRASFHARLGSLPFPVPSGFSPLLLLVLEASGTAWTWQMAVP